MSHFAFGVLRARKNALRESAYSRCDVAWGGELQPTIVLEMLALSGKPEEGETAFSLFFSGDDTADELISPYRRDAASVLDEVLRMISWLEVERQSRRAELWLTEGYDDNFKEVRGSCIALQEYVVKLLAEASDLPSVRLILE